MKGLLTIKLGPGFEKQSVGDVAEVTYGETKAQRGAVRNYSAPGVRHRTGARFSQDLGC